MEVWVASRHVVSGALGLLSPRQTGLRPCVRSWSLSGHCERRVTVQVHGQTGLRPCARSPSFSGRRSPRLPCHKTQPSLQGVTWSVTRSPESVTRPSSRYHSSPETRSTRPRTNQSLKCRPSPPPTSVEHRSRPTPCATPTSRERSRTHAWAKPCLAGRPTMLVRTQPPETNTSRGRPPGMELPDYPVVALTPHRRTRMGPHFRFPPGLFPYSYLVPLPAGILLLLSVRIIV
jgi:hypothetical protein